MKNTSTGNDEFTFWEGFKTGVTIGAILILFSMIISMVFAMPEPVGVRQVGSDTILVWNQGNIANETYYGLSSGLWQYANTRNREGDVVYVYGGAKNASGTWFYKINSTWGGTVSNGTDWQNYYWLASSGSYSMDGAQATITKNDGQSLYDSRVNMTITFKSPTAKTGEYYLVSGLRQLDIGQDGVHDHITLVNLINSSLEWVENETGSRWWNNITQLTIDGNQGADRYAYTIYFPKGVIMMYNHTSKSTNGDWTFYERIGNIVAGKQYNYSYEWIDASCASSCPPGCTVTGVLSNLSGAGYFFNIAQNQNRSVVACRMTCGGIGCGIIGCSLVGGGCGVSLRAHDKTVTWGDTEKSIKCGVNSSYTKCDNFAQGANCATWYNPKIIGGRYFGSDGYDYGSCRLDTDMHGTGYDDEFDIYVYNSTVNSTLWGLVNNTALNYSANWIVPGCNWTNFTGDNMSVIINGTVNYTVSPGSNFTRNISFDGYSGGWNVQCRACYSYNCMTNWNGIWNVSERHFITGLNCWTPLNNTVYNISHNWSVFSCNWTGDVAVNTSIIINGTFNYTNSGTSNLSKNMSFDNFGMRLWQGQVCNAENCTNLNDEGKYVLSWLQIISSIEQVVSTKIIPTINKHTSLFVWLIVVGFLLVVFLVWDWQERKKV